MAVKLLQVLVLGVIAAAAVDGALVCVHPCRRHVLARARVYGGGRMREPPHRVKHRPNLKPTYNYMFSVLLVSLDIDLEMWPLLQTLR